MKVSDFDYELPPERIADSPASPRDAARLFVHDVASGRSEHAHVRDLPAFLAPGDLMVVNDTRVRAARLVGARASGGAVEMLLVEREASGAWRALVKPAARLKPGELVTLEGGALVARMLVRETSGDGHGEWRVELLSGATRERASDDELERHGRMPLPPYLHRPRGEDPRRDADRASYQTLFARELGAVAAPTAGLHFTPELLAALDRRGVERAQVTLHVGEGTFRSVEVEDTDAHRMHSERFVLDGCAADAIRAARARHGRVVAVGTTSARTLESCALDDPSALVAGPSGLVAPRAGETRLFVVPPYRFRVVDVLLTNFHLPRSTLLMLVSAFAGRERVLELYREAIARGYRFYSYGDALLLVGEPRHSSAARS
ncbi:MAG: tRNA preQ1(34) S-adenosylmethionine ribosyltransferase-isomerase QueA [Planctomycetes bacterium]|nr:tRNA preQ1(34) S-adenosylmethionine ribosyltransferase-isomerase QueA [Planctomycetota bacterium]